MDEVSVSLRSVTHSNLFRTREYRYRQGDFSVESTAMNLLSA